MTESLKSKYNRAYPSLKPTKVKDSLIQDTFLSLVNGLKNGSFPTTIMQVEQDEQNQQIHIDTQHQGEMQISTSKDEGNNPLDSEAIKWEIEYIRWFHSFHKSITHIQK